MQIWRPYTQMATAAPSLPAESAAGAFLRIRGGKSVLDGISSWWLITHGHCHPEIAEAIAKQAQELDQVVFANFTHPAAEALVEKLAEFLPPELNRVFFSDNGSTAVESAMKMAYQACQQRGEKRRKLFLAFEHAFHGDTCGAMSVSADGTFTQAYGSMRFPIIRAKQGIYQNDAEELWLDDFREKLDRFGDEIAAVLLEPLIQGAAGMVLWPIAAARKVAELCRERGILLVFDEVMTGFGRTGSLFAFEQIGVTPDFLCLSKGLTGGSLPLALTLTTESVYDAFLSEEMRHAFFHGHSFTGNAISCAAAVANLRIFQKENVLEKIRGIEESHRLSLKKFASRTPVRDMRYKGVIGAAEIELPIRYQSYGGAFSRRVHSLCLEEGVFLRPLGNIVYLLPPYCTKPSEIETAWEIVARACSTALAELL